MLLRLCIASASVVERSIGGKVRVGDLGGGGPPWKLKEEFLGESLFEAFCAVDLELGDLLECHYVRP